VCRKSKTRCNQEEADSKGQNMYGAIQELSDLVDGNFEDVYNLHCEIKGSLHDLIQFEAARFQLEFRD
jgi:hypothetical protein